jgi:hypothetical protein
MRYRYCGQPAGFFSQQHKECRKRHDEGARLIQSMISQSSSSTSALIDNLPAEISRVSAYALVSDEERNALVVSAWAQAVERALEDGILSETEESNLNRVANRLSLTQQTLDRTGAFTRVAKAGALRDLLNGSVPDRFRVEGDISINLKKGEHLVWLFNNVEYLEDKKHRSYVGRSTGVSMRIMKGFYYRTSEFRGHPVERTERARVDKGTMYVTDQGIYFVGVETGKSLRIPYSKIVAFLPFSDAVGVVRDTASAVPQIFVTADGWFTYNLVTNLARL